MRGMEKIMKKVQNGMNFAWQIRVIDSNLWSNNIESPNYAQF